LVVIASSRDDVVPDGLLNTFKAGDLKTEREITHINRITILVILKRQCNVRACMEPGRQGKKLGKYESGLISNLGYLLISEV